MVKQPTTCNGTLTGFQTTFPKHEFKMSKRGNIVRRVGKTWKTVCIHNRIKSQCKVCIAFNQSKTKFFQDLSQELGCDIDNGFISRDKLSNKGIDECDWNRDIKVEFHCFQQNLVADLEQKFKQMVDEGFVVFYVWEHEYKGNAADVCRRFINKLET